MSILFYEDRGVAGIFHVILYGEVRLFIAYVAFPSWDLMCCFIFFCRFSETGLEENGSFPPLVSRRRL